MLYSDRSSRCVVGALLVVVQCALYRLLVVLVGVLYVHCRLLVVASRCAVGALYRLYSICTLAYLRCLCLFRSVVFNTAKPYRRQYIFFLLNINNSAR